MAVWSQAVGALLFLAVAGAARSLFDVAGRTLLQRTAPADVLARVFGILEALIMAGTAVGALIAPLLVNLGGTTAGDRGVGAHAAAARSARRPAAVRARRGGPRPGRRDRASPLADALRGAAPASIEGLARSLEPLSVATGTAIVTQGDEGDRYYAIAEGEFEVTRDGMHVNSLARGDGFGEIALLHDVVRTATVRAVSEARVYALDKAHFLEVLTGHPVAHTAAKTIAAERLAVVEG